MCPPAAASADLRVEPAMTGQNPMRQNDDHVTVGLDTSIDQMRRRTRSDQFESSTATT